MYINVLGEDMQKDLKVVLEFVERFNKQDSEKEVAESASKLSSLIDEEKVEEETNEPWTDRPDYDEHGEPNE